MTTQTILFAHSDTPKARERKLNDMVRVLYNTSSSLDNTSKSLDQRVSDLEDLEEEVKCCPEVYSNTRRIVILENALNLLLTNLTTRVTTSPYDLLLVDKTIFVNTNGGAITINLPAGVDGKEYRIINTGSSGNDVTVVPNGAELLVGSNTSRTLSDGSVIILVYEPVEGWW